MISMCSLSKQYLDTDVKLITEDYRVLLKDQIELSVKENFGTLSDFLKRWNDSDRKQAIVEELAEHGIKLELLQRAIPNGDELDVFGQYGEQAKLVLEALVDKFAQYGVQDIENPKILELPPFDQLGSKTQIRRNIFGGLDKYQQAIKELENELFRDDLTA